MENKTTKISVSTFFLIVALVIIIVMGIFMSKMNKEKIEATNKSSELQTQVDNLNGEVSDLQGKIDNIKNTINSNNTAQNTVTTDIINNNNNNNNTSFTNEQVKECLSNYLELLSHSRCSSLLECLSEKGALKYDYTKNTPLENEGILTTIKFTDYKKAMLNYVTETEFEKNWTNVLGFSQNNKGYLIRLEGGGGLAVYTIGNITKINETTYSANTSYIVDEDDTMKGNEDYTFSVKSYNGKCVIDSIK